jgi:cytochrome c biogenesis protein CcdA
MGTILFTLSISLFDSFSTTQQIIIFVLLLTPVKPVRNGVSYLAGLIGVYFACGVVAYPVIDQLRAFLGRFFPSTANLSNPVYYQVEFICGIIMAGLGLLYYRKKRHAPPNRAENMVVARLRSMNAYVAFGIGAFISVTSFPVSIPYLIALGRYATLHIGLPAATGLIVLYNVGYALPMLAILVIYLYARRGTEDLTDRLHEKARRLNVQLTTWALAGVGIFSMIDAGWYFAFGRALVKGRML